MTLLTVSNPTAHHHAQPLLCRHVREACGAATINGHTSIRWFMRDFDRCRAQRAKIFWKWCVIWCRNRRHRRKGLAQTVGGAPVRLPASLPVVIRPTESSFPTAVVVNCQQDCSACNCGTYLIARVPGRVCSSHLCSPFKSFCWSRGLGRYVFSGRQETRRYVMQRGLPGQSNAQTG